MLKHLPHIELSVRQGLVLAAASLALLLALSIMWLSMSTRTAVLNAQITELDAARRDLSDQINQRWTEIGQAGVPETMQTRAQQLGFKQGTLEYLVLPTPVITATVVISN
jgi:cell division protein FtsL